MTAAGRTLGVCRPQFRGLATMRNRQQGVTAIGWLVLLTPFAILLYAGIRLAPLYLNYMKVVRAMDGAASSVKSGAGAGAGAGDATAIRTAIDRHFEIDMVEYPTIKDIQIRREGTAWVIEAKYDDEAPLFANLSLHVTFDKTVRSRGGGD
jgi:hypothetical protein